MVCGIDTYDMITYFAWVNFNILSIGVLFFRSIPAVTITNFSRSNETRIIADTYLVPPNNSEPTIIIDELNTIF